MSKKLIDSRGRRLKKLRLNLLDACNMRCMYCMPENQKFNPLKSLLSGREMKEIVANLVAFGIEEVRLTGGEPLLHPNFQEIVAHLSELKLKKLAVTTNALLLRKNMDFLEKYGVKHVNVSLDSLQRESFNFITKRDGLKEVLAAIMEAKERGFTVKTNTILLKNINFEEIEDFLEFSAKYDVETRFLELMKIGQAMEHYQRHFVSAQEALDRIAKSWTLDQVLMPKDSTSFNYIARKGTLFAKAGFIASESKPFCGGCSRLRLSNKGQLRPCIMINEGPNLKGLASKDYEKTLSDLIELKPAGRPYGTNVKMNEIGG